MISYRFDVKQTNFYNNDLLFFFGPIVLIRTYELISEALKRQFF